MSPAMCGRFAQNLSWAEIPSPRRSDRPAAQSRVPLQCCAHNADRGHVARRPLALAGIWDRWSGLAGDDLPNATIIVGEANDWMRSFHDRMPVILDWRDAGAWMTGESPGALLRQAPDDALQEWIVPTRVNKSGAGDVASGFRGGAIPRMLGALFQKDGIITRPWRKSKCAALSSTVNSFAIRQVIN